ncbi:hypothetical protein ACSVDA_21410 [Cytobacillus sp. Hm23]
MGFVVVPRLSFNNLKDKMLFLHFMESANYESSKNCERGELITSITKLEEEIGWTYKVIRNILERLKKSGYINVETLNQKRGIKVKISEYSNFQTLEKYQKKGNEKGKEEGKEKGKGIKEQKPCGSMDKQPQKNKKGKEEGKQMGNEKGNTLTSFITSLNNININKTLKEYIDEAKVKSKNLTSTEDIETFVDFALRTNALPESINDKILISYFDCIRLNRSTCNISANILVNFIEKIQKYSIDQIHYALWKHFEEHDDKRESYTLGILRNTKEHEARRGLIKLKNKGGQEEHAKLPKAVGGTQSSTSKEVQRLNEIARRKGLNNKIRDVDCDF